MTQIKSELPVYLYIKNVRKGIYDYFLGNLYKGRNPRKDEIRMYKKDNNRQMETDHSLISLTNLIYSADMTVNCLNKDKGFAFPTFDSVITKAINTYKRNGYTSGLILGFDYEELPMDKVLIIGEGDYNTNHPNYEFFKAAQERKFWVEKKNVI